MAEELRSYMGEQLSCGVLTFAGRPIGSAKVIWKPRSDGVSRRIQDQQRRLAILKAARQTGKVRLMALLAREFTQIDLAEIRREEILSPQSKPPSVVVIDEVGPPYSPAPALTPRFAQLSCLRRQRSR